MKISYISLNWLQQLETAPTAPQKLINNFNTLKQEALQSLQKRLFLCDYCFSLSKPRAYCDASKDSFWKKHKVFLSSFMAYSGVHYSLLLMKEVWRNRKVAAVSWHRESSSFTLSGEENSLNYQGNIPMSKPMTSGAMPAVTPSKETNPIKLQNTIELMDCLSQQAFSEIASIALLALKALEAPQPYDLIDDIAIALEAIRSKAQDIENCISCEAEDVGCNSIDKAQRRRRAARMATAQVEVSHA